MEPLTCYREENKRRYILNWVAVAALMVFYALTWLWPMFYHVTEKYASSIIFLCLALLFFNNVDWVERLKKGEKDLLALLAAGIIAFVNLLIIGSNLGCILILIDMLLLWYLADKVRLDRLQMEFMCAVFTLVFLVWYLIDLAFFYNSNTGASLTVFTSMCVMALITRISAKKELYQLVTVLCFVRIIHLVLWHLARGAFVALFLFMLFYYVVPTDLWKSRKWFRGIVIFATFGSLAFVFLYVAAAATGMNFKMPFFYKNLFSGREQIWMEIWDKLKEHFLTGIGSGYELESFFEYNIHNVMYDILAVHGVIVFALSAFILVRKLLMMRKGLEHLEGNALRMKTLAVSGIFAIAIESFIDMDFMWPDYSPVILFLALIAFKDPRKT